ncbi:pyridoxamine 5'-phosphate oxidase family protein [Mesorhizobium atlanticum]
MRGCVKRKGASKDRPGFSIQAETRSSQRRPDGSPEVAIIRVTLGDGLNIVFDSFPGSRKLANIERDNRIAMVIGWDQNITVQIEGLA